MENRQMETRRHTDYHIHSTVIRGSEDITDESSKKVGLFDLNEDVQIFYLGISLTD